MWLALVVFWVSVVWVIYIYAGYPLLIALWASKRPRPLYKGLYQGDVCVVLVVHNEADRIKTKLDFLVGADPGCRIKKIIVASDGSTDDTAAIVQDYKNDRVSFMPFEQRRGKAEVLNDVLPDIEEDIVLFTDARQRIDPSAIDALLRNFADHEVGAVSGELVFETGSGKSAVSEGMGAYWNYEKNIRRAESLVHSVPGATGAFYAIRKDLLGPFPRTVLLDDVAIPMQAAVMGGKRCVFESEAVVYDQPSEEAWQEQVRKRRTIAGTAQLVRLFPSWMNPRKNPIWFQYISHKLFRLTSPILLLAVVVSNAFLLSVLFYRISFVLEGLIVGLAILGSRGHKAGSLSRSFGVLWLFLVLNWTTVLALWDASRGRYLTQWSRTS